MTTVSHVNEVIRDCLPVVPAFDEVRPGVDEVGMNSSQLNIFLLCSELLVEAAHETCAVRYVFFDVSGKIARVARNSGYR